LKQVFQVGTARRLVTPPPGVELAGLGYYLNRTWERVSDDLTATALVVGEGKTSIALVAVDMMYNDAQFTRRVRELAVAETDLKPKAICVNFSHTHNAPTAGLILGAGERDFQYLETAAKQAAVAIVEAWQKRGPARLSVGRGELAGMTFNRTRENGPVDNTVSVLRADSPDGQPLAIAVNFHSHCTAHMESDLRAVTRDWPGEVVDQIEAALPGATALYLQGTCGDVNFRREFNGTARRFEPARAITNVVLAAIEQARPVEAAGVSAISRKVTLPTRRWSRQEVMREREEGLYRLKSGDTTGWLEGVARVCVNQPQRLPLRYDGSVEKAVAAVSRFVAEWTDSVLPDLETRPELIETDVQALRFGDIFLVANPAELFTSLGLEARRQWEPKNLFMLSYSNGSIGYMPDAFEIERGGYAAVQSPKFTGQFPFTAESGASMIKGMVDALTEAQSS
jgi:neutral ceramidase